MAFVPVLPEDPPDLRSLYVNFKGLEAYCDYHLTGAVHLSNYLVDHDETFDYMNRHVNNKASRSCYDSFVNSVRNAHSSLIVSLAILHSRRFTKAVCLEREQLETYLMNTVLCTTGIMQRHENWVSASEDLKIGGPTVNCRIKLPHYKTDPEMYNVMEEFEEELDYLQEEYDNRHEKFPYPCECIKCDGRVDGEIVESNQDKLRKECVEDWTYKIYKRNTYSVMMKSNEEWQKTFNELVVHNKMVRARALQAKQSGTVYITPIMQIQAEAKGDRMTTNVSQAVERMQRLVSTAQKKAQRHTFCSHNLFATCLSLAARLLKKK